MSKTPQRIQCPEAKAEGNILLTHNGTEYVFPYDTQLAGPDGCHIHFWMGSYANVSGLALAARKEAQNYRDIVSCSYSIGEPQGFWAHQDMD